MDLEKLALGIVTISHARLDELRERACKEGKDFHCLVAVEAMGLMDADADLRVTPGQRNAAKQGLFMYLYGVSDPEKIKRILSS